MDVLFTAKLDRHLFGQTDRQPIKGGLRILQTNLCMVEVQFSE